MSHTYKLPDLDYAYTALEPHIDARTMEIHHTKHHGTYVTKLNEALASIHFTESRAIEVLLSDLNKFPESVRTVIRNNGGGHANHAFFWKILSPKAGSEPVGKLAEAMRAAFGDYAHFKEKFAAAALSRFGSGWAWLYVKKDSTLAIGSTPNQDNPWMKGFVDCEGSPIIGLDVWEHAYYLHYQNRRADYINAFWSLVDWNKANENYLNSI